MRLNPYCHRLVGGEFSLGDNPRVSAQFSAQFCAANALARASSKLPHFRPEQVADASLRSLIDRVTCTGDAALDARGHTAVDVAITAADGEVYARQLDVAPGFPGNELSAAEHEARFEDCLRYAAYPLPGAQVGAFLDAVDTLETVPDARALVDCLIAESVPERSASAERITAAVARSTR